MKIIKKNSLNNYYILYNKNDPTRKSVLLCKMQT